MRADSTRPISSAIPEFQEAFPLTNSWPAPASLASRDAGANAIPRARGIASPKRGGPPPQPRAGFLLMDSSLRPLSFNGEAVQILGYPDEPAIKGRPDMFLVRKIRSSLMGHQASCETPFVTEFRSGKRRYLVPRLCSGGARQGPASSEDSAPIGKRSLRPYGPLKRVRTIPPHSTRGRSVGTLSAGSKQQGDCRSDACESKYGEELSANDHGQNGRIVSHRNHGANYHDQPVLSWQTCVFSPRFLPANRFSSRPESITQEEIAEWASPEGWYE